MENEMTEVMSESGQVDETTGTASEQTTEELVAEIERLRGELGRLTEWQSRSRRELDEFCTLFPGVSLAGLPEEVRASVDAGVPMAAAYALYEKREAARKSAGKKSAELSWHGMNHAGGEDYFTPSDVRSMSQKEVHKNYKKIMESMKHWK